MMHAMLSKVVDDVYINRYRFSSHVRRGIDVWTCGVVEFLLHSCTITDIRFECPGHLFSQYEDYVGIAPVFPQKYQYRLV
jgi:hypothetical protein